MGGDRVPFNIPMMRVACDRRRLVTLPVGLLCVVAAGCQTEQRAARIARRPATVVLEQWRTHAPTTQPNAAPLTVDRAVEEALRASRKLEQIEDRLDAAAAQVREAEAAFYPRVTLAQDFSATDNPVFALMYIINQKRATQNLNFNNPGQQQNATSSIEGRWSLFEGGARWYDRKAAAEKRRSAAADLQAARNKLVGAVVETYYRWLQALDFVTVAQRAVDVATENENLAEDRLEAQMVLKSEVLRLKTNLAESQSQLVTARNSARKWQAALERLLVRRIDAGEIPEVTAPATPQTPSQDTDVLVEHALARRAELAEVDALIAAARARVKAAEGEWLPQVSAHAQYEWNSEDLTGAQPSWLAGVQATWNIFDGGLTPSRVRAARANLRETTKRGEQIALDIALEVHQAAIGLEDAVAKIKVATEQKRWADQGLDETRQLYKNQIVTVDALLQAELAWNRAEVSYCGAVFDGKIAEATLQQALGDLADWTEGSE